MTQEAAFARSSSASRLSWPVLIVAGPAVLQVEGQSLLSFAPWAVNYSITSWLVRVGVAEFTCLWKPKESAVTLG